jgi:hypothetical protein
MNNFHIYEEVGRGQYSVVYKVSLLSQIDLNSPFLSRVEKRKQSSTLQSNPWRKTARGRS